LESLHAKKNWSGKITKALVKEIEKGWHKSKATTT